MAADKNSLEQQLGTLLRPGQSLDLLKHLHILTAEGKLNQDTRRKLKQVNHLLQFIEPLLAQLRSEGHAPHIVDHGAGKSYLGFLLYDAMFHDRDGSVWGIESRRELVESAQILSKKLGFARMGFVLGDTAHASGNDALPAQVHVVTALHACNTATDDAIRFGLNKQAQFMVLVPCCQAEVAAALRDTGKTKAPTNNVLSAMWARPLHTREFGSQLTNVLRCLQLEAAGYTVTVTELVGWEHSMKNELIIAKRNATPNARKQDAAHAKIEAILNETHLAILKARFL